jgi:TRAP transporter TAXI family solute receptor
MTSTTAPASCLLRLAVLAAACAGAACHTPPDPQPTRTVVRLTSGTPGAGFHPLGAGLARAFERSVPGVALQVQESPGAVRNVEALQEGSADIGFAFADVAYMAYVGELAPAVGPFDRLRGIAVLQLTPLHLAVRPGAMIRAVEDLRGARVGIGPPGSGTALTSGIVLRAFGIRPDELQTVLVPFDEVAGRLERGALDAAFVNGGYPAESIALATSAGARLLPVEGAPIARLRAEYPFLRLTFIPSGTYAGHERPVSTIGVDNLLLCRRDLPEALVYELTKSFFDVLPDLSLERISLRMMDLDQAPATLIPLHDGAARYYRELELTR